MLPVRKNGSVVAEQSVRLVDEDRCERILVEKANRPAWAALGSYIRPGESGRNLTDFWRELISPGHKYFLDYFDTELRRDFLEEMRLLVPIVAKYGTALPCRREAGSRRHGRPKLSTRFEAQEIKETGNEED